MSEIKEDPKIKASYSEPWSGVKFMPAEEQAMFKPTNPHVFDEEEKRAAHLKGLNRSQTPAKQEPKIQSRTTLRALLADRKPIHQ